MLFNILITQRLTFPRLRHLFCFCDVIDHLIGVEANTVA
jgi:hypothetical protein